MKWMRVRTLASVVIALVLAAAVAACGDDDKKESGAKSVPSGQPGKGKPAVTMGDKNFTEQYVLGDLYKQALEAKGFTVKLKGNIGSSEIIDKALTSGKIDMYPEYMGVIDTVIAGGSEEQRPKSAEEAYQK